MIKVLIVDDEYYSRKGLKCIIPWEKMKCKVLGEASNAYEAINIAKEIKPDIIITDINMPEINGIEMAKNIKEILPNTKFIVITGYDDFQYARGAVKINALDFILKPIQVSEFTEAINNAVSLIEKERINNSLSIEKQILRIVRGQSPIEIIDNYFNLLDSIRIVLINNDSYEYFNNNNKDYLNTRISYIVKEWIRNNISSYYIFEPHANRIGIIITTSENVDFKELIKRIIEELDGVITISITQEESPLELRELYKRAKNLYEKCFYEGYGKVLKEQEKKELTIDHLKFDELVNEIVDNILNADIKKAEKSINYLFKIFSYKMIKKSKIIKVVLELVLRVKQGFIELGISSQALEAIELENDYNQMIDLKKDLETFIVVAVENIREYRGTLEDSSIKRAIKFINNNFNKNISLKVVASSVYLNESYLSRELKQTLGMGFSEYIRKLRIEKAMELLKKGFSVSSVAKEVGYSDYRQFSTNFKKYTGDVPSNYKE
ncbi:response regulator transcription factor [Clostridium chauvoei]|uniref:response regulator transcription factor n=1 Tax=Clostridium chauvoei TaxID=46867 RepID=UPI001C85F858|nr:response regulator [Clostridium chauvoei]MBX7409379.1 response regulator [Clostridium chauvoei]